MESGHVKDKWWIEIRQYFILSIYVFPWIELFDLLTGEIERVRRAGLAFAGRGELSWQAYVMFLRYARYDSPEIKTFQRGAFKVGAQEEAYLAHIDEIRRSVPSGQLMTFDVRRHGFFEMAAFLGVAPTSVDGIDLTGYSLPRSRSKSSWSNDVLVDNYPLTVWSCLVAIGLLHIPNVIMLCHSMTATFQLLTKVVNTVTKR